MTLLKLPETAASKTKGPRSFWHCCSNPSLKLHKQATNTAPSVPSQLGTARSLAAFHRAELFQPRGDEIPPELFLRQMQTAAAPRRRPLKVWQAVTGGAEQPRRCWHRVRAAAASRCGHGRMQRTAAGDCSGCETRHCCLPHTRTITGICQGMFPHSRSVSFYLTLGCSEKEGTEFPSVPWLLWKGQR